MEKPGQNIELGKKSESCSLGLGILGKSDPYERRGQKTG